MYILGQDFFGSRTRVYVGLFFFVSRAQFVKNRKRGKDYGNFY